jgi:hypothetical protein
LSLHHVNPGHALKTTILPSCADLRICVQRANGS